jgi:hypothetical protein
MVHGSQYTSVLDFGTRPLYWLCTDVKQWDLVQQLCIPVLRSKKIVQAFATPGPNRSFVGEWGFKNEKEFYDLLDKLEHLGNVWHLNTLNKRDDSPAWVPEEIKFYYKDSMEIVKHLVGDKRLEPFTRWAPAKLYDAEGNRVYTDLWNSDWWWDEQVVPEHIRLGSFANPCHHLGANSSSAE